jgi:hypothetical protein
MSKERFDQVIDEVYQNYAETHENEPFIMINEMGLSREEFIKMATNNYEFGFLFGIRINERELSLEERERLYREHCIEHFWALKLNETNEAHYERANIPTKLITLTYNNETIEVYE